MNAGSSSGWLQAIFGMNESSTDSMIEEWNLRTEILEMSHRWPVFLLFVLAGCLVGWGTAYIIPTPYRAETSLHVSYNADNIARNPDDYKNWQLQELNTLIFSKDVLQDTLHRLRPIDGYWNNINPAALQSQLRVYWRNAGQWRMVAENRSPLRAAQLLETWSSVVIEVTGSATGHAHALQDVEQQLRITAAQNAAVQLRLFELAQAQPALQAWIDANREGDLNRKVDTLERWKLLALAGRAAGPNPAGTALMAQAPDPDAGVEPYLPWIEAILGSIEGEKPSLLAQQEELGALQNQLSQYWQDELAASRGLTRYLVVENIDNESAPVPVRPSSTMALIGGVLGLLLWVLVWLGRAARLKK